MQRITNKILQRIKSRLWITKPVIFCLLLSAYSAPCFSDTTVDSLHNAVKKALSKFGRNSIKIHYLFDKEDFLHPKNLKDSGWDSTVHKAWIYNPDCECCNQVDYLKCVGNDLTGFMINSKKHRGDTTDIGGWEIELASGYFTFLGSSSYGIIGSGKMVYSEGYGEMESAGALGHVSRSAIYMNAFIVQPVVEKETIDTVIYQDSIGKKLICFKISSIAVGLSNNDNYFNCSSHYPGQRSTIQCSTLPAKCLPDTGEIIISEIKRILSEYQFSFVVKNESGSCGVTIFRTRDDCESFAHRCTNR